MRSGTGIHMQNSKLQQLLFSDVASAFNQPCVSLRRLSMWTGRRCCREKHRRPSSRPSAARRTSVTLTRSSPLKCPRSLLRGSPACSPAKTRKASGTLTTSRTSAEGPRGSSMSWMFRLDSIVTFVHKERDTVSTDLSVDCLSANNYTVNECEEAEGLRVSPSGQGLRAFGAEQAGKGSKHFIRVEGKRKPPLFLQTPVVCVSWRHLPLSHLLLSCCVLM